MKADYRKHPANREEQFGKTSRKERNKIENEYNQLMYDVKTHEFYTRINLENRFNCYVCGLGHITKTKDVDAGVTPFIMKCDECGSEAKSTMYRDISPDKPHTGEWFRPSLKRVQKMHPWMREHVLQGGLEYRKIESSQTN